MWNTESAYQFQLDIEPSKIGIGVATGGSFNKRLAMLVIYHHDKRGLDAAKVKRRGRRGGISGA
ncbi:hypothetical protein ACNJYC_09435 [Bradyrhizobium sp. DASA03007]|uniref:hypothetical protein n=1 Tax=Bradyrhizobium sp. SPXBL-03 TaxID=3395913 RepID=UPI003F70A1BB